MTLEIIAPTVFRQARSQARFLPRKCRLCHERDRRPHIALDELGFDAKNAHTVRANKKRITYCVLLAPLAMNATIDFDDEPPRRDEKIDDERQEHMLPPNANPDLATANLRPEQSLAASGLLPHLASEAGE